MVMFIHFCCLCCLGLTIKLNFNILKVAYFCELSVFLFRISMQKIHRSRFLKDRLALLMTRITKAIRGWFLLLRRKSRIDTAQQGHIISSKAMMQTILVKENRQTQQDFVFEDRGLVLLQRVDGDMLPLLERLMLGGVTLLRVSYQGNCCFTELVTLFILISCTHVTCICYLMSYK